jgi:hypothetical protein
MLIQSSNPHPTFTLPLRRHTVSAFDSTETLCIEFSLLMALSAGIAVGTLLGWHVYLCLTNQVTHVSSNAMTLLSRTRARTYTHFASEEGISLMTQHTPFILSLSHTPDHD